MERIAQWAAYIPSPSQAVLKNIPPDALDSFTHSLNATTATAKMIFSKLVSAVFCASVAFTSYGAAVPTSSNPLIKPYNGAPLQNIVTWDSHSIFVRGERIMLFNGEFHPYRLPVTSLWLDVFQKLKSAGFSGVSFYVDW
jgi:hypothetical protein